MQLNTNRLLGFSLSATDGEVGKIEEIYFDDRNWAIRYLVVKTGHWLSGRKVLISPLAFDGSNGNSRTFPVNLTKEQILNSPDINTDGPLSLQHTKSLNEYYSWQPFIDNGFYAPVHCDQPDLIETAPINGPSADNFHLRSTRETRGFHIHATDGEIGFVNDFIVDDKDWKIEYLVVMAKSIFGNQKILISVRDISKIKWAKSNIYLDISVKAVEQSKTFDGSTFSDPETVDADFI
jgi:sporulation protein YlmC with PRC-barrel domain